MVGRGGRARVGYAGDREFGVPGGSRKQDHFKGRDLAGHESLEAGNGGVGPDGVAIGVLQIQRDLDAGDRLAGVVADLAEEMERGEVLL